MNKENYGAGGFSDQYDNQRARSLDDNQNPGGVTGFIMEEDYDLSNRDYFPPHGEAWDRRTRWEPRERDSFRLTHDEVRADSMQGRGPRGLKWNDVRIQEEVSEALLHSHDVDASHLEVKVQDACVTLSGSVPQKFMKQVAVDLIYSVPCVEDVFTHIKVG